MNATTLLIVSYAADKQETKVIHREGNVCKHCSNKGDGIIGSLVPNFLYQQFHKIILRRIVDRHSGTVQG